MVLKQALDRDIYLPPSSSSRVCASLALTSSNSISGLWGLSAQRRQREKSQGRQRNLKKQRLFDIRSWLSFHCIVVFLMIMAMTLRNKDINSLSSDWLKPDVSSVEYFCNLFSSHCRLIFLKKVDISIFATCCKVEQAGSSHWNQRNLSPLFVSFTYFGKTMCIYIGLCLISLCWCDSLVMPEVKIGQQCSSCPLRHRRATPPPNLGSKIIVPFVWRPCADHTMLIRPWDLWVVLGVTLLPVAGHGINWRRRGVFIWLHG